MFQADGHAVTIASSSEDGLQQAAEIQPDLILLDVRLPNEDGISALPKFLAQQPEVPVIIMTAFGDLETAVSAVKNGAADYITKPFDLEVVQRACRNALADRQRREQPDQLTKKSKSAGSRLVGTSAAMQLVFKQIAFVASSDLAVLITGETGTGKELVAEAIHKHSLRSQQPYLRIAPVALNESLIESELFGHVKGAFTGAAADRAGVFEEAEGGTVLLDEIGELPLSIQVKLLRVLEQGEYSRVGESQTRRCDVRILAATNADLVEAVKKGEFREDLYYRLNGLQMHLPPLSQRTEDLRPLAEYFLSQVNYGNANAITDELAAQLSAKPWHGNVREFRNAIQQAAVLARGRTLTMDDFPVAQPPSVRSSFNNGFQDVISAWAQGFLQSLDHETVDSPMMHQKFLAEAEPVLIKAALEYTNGNRSKAAELLGIHRATLREKMRSVEDEPTRD